MLNFLESERFEWIKESAISEIENWIIEPQGFGESRLDGLKLYCKVDFLTPFDGKIVILEWKTGKNEKGVPFIQRVHHASKFMQGIDFVGKVAEAAEENNHHPDIIINYKRISIRYWTHTASGVTLADIQMAQKIDPLF